MYKTLLSLSLFALIPFITWAQPSLKQQKLIFDQKSQKIIIPYILSDGGDYRYEYNVEVYYTQDNGKTYKGPLEALKGFHGKEVLAKDSLAVWWFHKEEDPNFDGQNTKMKLKVDYTPSVFNLQNEEAMKYSVLLPGLGQTKVKHRKGWKYKWLATPLLVYGGIAASLLVNNQANRTYDQYQTATTRAEAQDLFDQASQQRQLAVGLALVAGGIWATDIILVGLRGRKNRLKKQQIIEKNNEMKQEISVQISRLNEQQYLPTLGMRIKF
ncbi:MAG: DUF5683 domain-containing protein [Bacteroidota bacterium]